MVEPNVAGVISCALLLLLLTLGLPIAACLGLAGMVGIFLAVGLTGPFLAIISTAFNQLTSIGLLAVPMFILMGNLVVAHDLGADLYGAVHKWVSRIPGGLIVASVVFSALFGFVCGSGLAGTATIGGLAIPEMMKRGYARRIALGSLAVAGCLAVLIPPSVLMIVYAVQAEVSMGWMFFAGIVPGLLLALLMCIFIAILAVARPGVAPAGDRFPLSERLKSLRYLAPIVLIFVIVLGGIYAGIWSPVEAGAGGSMVTVLIALIMRRMKWSTVRAAAFGAAKTTVMIYMVVAGATILALMFHLTGLTEMIKQLVLGLSLPGWAIIMVILFIMMILGCFMDPLPILLITLPVSLPVVSSLGYDLVWWGIVVIISCEMAQITPPVGLHLFVILGIAPKGTTLVDVAMGASPYVAILWVLMGILIAFPQLVMWLPMTMKGG